MQGQPRINVPSACLPGPSKRLLIAGKWQPSASGQAFDTVNPATGKVIARLAAGDAAISRVDRLIAMRFQTWA